MMKWSAVMFHHFFERGNPKGQGAIGVDEFVEIIERHGNDRFLPARDWIVTKSRGALRENDLCLTFDDGLMCQIDTALPVLEYYNLTAFWFIYTVVHEGGREPFEIHRYFRTEFFETIDEFYDAFDQEINASAWGDYVAAALSAFDPPSYKPYAKYYSDRDRIFRHVRDNVLGGERYSHIMDLLMDRKGFDVDGVVDRLWIGEAMLRDLHDNGHVIGLHSHTHPPRIDRLSKTGQFKEYETNATVLERILGERPRSMAHPFNAYNAETFDVLEQLRVDIGFATTPRHRTDSELELARIDHGTFLAALRNG